MLRCWILLIVFSLQKWFPQSNAPSVNILGTKQRRIATFHFRFRRHPPRRLHSNSYWKNTLNWKLLLLIVQNVHVNKPIFGEHYAYNIYWVLIIDSLIDMKLRTFPESLFFTLNASKLMEMEFLKNQPFVYMQRRK